MVGFLGPVGDSLSGCFTFSPKYNFIFLISGVSFVRVNVMIRSLIGPMASSFLRNLVLIVPLKISY